MAGGESQRDQASNLGALVAAVLDDVVRAVEEAVSALASVATGGSGDAADVGGPGTPEAPAALAPRCGEAADIAAVRTVIDRRIGLAADQAGRGALVPVARTLQRLSGHLGVLADETDLSWGPFGVPPGDRLRQCAGALRRLAHEVSPPGGPAAVRTVMAGRLDALAALWNPGAPPARRAAELGQRLRLLRQGVALGADRTLAVAELRSIAVLLLMERQAAAPDDTTVGILRIRATVVRRSADWFAHPVNAVADLDPIAMPGGPNRALA